LKIKKKDSSLLESEYNVYTPNKSSTKESLSKRLAKLDEKETSEMEINNNI
jgi:hypothetical protein